MQGRWILLNICCLLAIQSLDCGCKFNLQYKLLKLLILQLLGIHKKIYILMSVSLCFTPGDHLSSQQGPPPLPPAPPPHKQHPSITSLSRSSLANQRSPSPPPTAGLAADLQSTAECVQLQDSWVLGSNVALESR